MLRVIILLDLGLLILDCVTVSELRHFILDFLPVKKKKSEKAYINQSLWDKIKLSYIQVHLRKHVKEFGIWHRIYLMVLYTLLPQYIILIGCNILLGEKSLNVLCLFALIKLCVSIGIYMHTDSNRVSVYRKK